MAPPAAPLEAAPLASGPASLEALLPDGAHGFAVLDLETTGTGRSCRIVEIALVRLDRRGRITEEWETLVQPGLPIPNAQIHGIDDAMVAAAPAFADIAGALAAKLHEHVLVAHNLRSFDGPILEAHFADVDGVELSLGDGMDTMPQPRLKLVELCRRHGVELDPAVAHTALGDTRALARALQNGMAHLRPATHTVQVQQNGRLADPCRPYTRAMAAAQPKPAQWSAIALPLQRGQTFITTGPASTRPDTEVKRGERHGIALGLIYRKVNAIPKQNPPAFLLATSLTLTTRKLLEARERQLPVVLCSDFLQAHCERTVRAWLFNGADDPS